ALHLVLRGYRRGRDRRRARRPPLRGGPARAKRDTARFHTRSLAREVKGEPVITDTTSMRPRVLIAGAAVVGAVTTLLVTVFPFIDLAYRSPSLHVVLETATTLTALFTAYLVYGRFRQSSQARDLALVGALVLLALKNL